MRCLSSLLILVVWSALLVISCNVNPDLVFDIPEPFTISVISKSDPRDDWLLDLGVEYETSDGDVVQETELTFPAFEGTSFTLKKGKLISDNVKVGTYPWPKNGSLAPKKFIFEDNETANKLLFEALWSCNSEGKEQRVLRISGIVPYEISELELLIGIDIYEYLYVFVKGDIEPGTNLWFSLSEGE